MQSTFIRRIRLIRLLPISVMLSMSAHAQTLPAPDTTRADSIPVLRERPVVPRLEPRDDGRDVPATGAFIMPDGVMTAERVDTSYAGPVIHDLDRRIDNGAFAVGEKLSFKIRYGFVVAGSATMEVRDMVAMGDGDSAYHVVTTARSASFFDAFYKVRDEVETYLDTEGFFSWRYHKQLREGGYKFDLLVDYDQPRGLADIRKTRYHDEEPLRIRNRSSFRVRVPEYVLDVLGAFYYVRTQPLEVGRPLTMMNHDNEKVYNLDVVVEKRETISVDAGKFRTLKIEPRLKGDAIFQQKGRMWIWVTDDDRHIPVQIKSKVVVGSITIELTGIEGVPEPIPARIRK